MKIVGQAAVVRPVVEPKRRWRSVDVLLWVLVAPAPVWAVARIGGWENGPLVQLMAFTPYVAAWSLVPLVLAVATRRWTTALVALVVAGVFAGLVLPRARTSDQGPAAGVELRVMTSNMLYGEADPATIVRLVRDNKVDVVTFQEFTPGGRQALEAAGLTALLPYSSLADEARASGSGLYSRFPITGAGSRRNGGGFLQAYGTVQPPGAGPLMIESVHPRAPDSPDLSPLWQADLADEPRPDQAGPPRILAGDFNATLDHRSLRDLTGDGYRDAGDATGKGLIPTWPYQDAPGIPPVTLDHVLVDQRIGVREMTVHRIPGSDHRAIIAVLTVPAA